MRPKRTFVGAMRGAAALLLGACGSDPPRVHEAAPVVDTNADDPCLASAAGLAPADAAVVRAACAERRTRRIPGVVVAIAERGEVVLRFAHGQRCSDRPDPVGEHTAFRIGSVTKAITAATAFALADHGGLDLDATFDPRGLAELGLDPSLATVTLRAALDHRAGLTEHAAHEGLRGRPRALQLAELVGRTTGPDAPWAYANGGYVLAGAWLARHAGLPWVTLVQHEVFGPLAMDHARAVADPTGDVACGHLPAGDAWDAFDVHEDFERFAFGLDVTAPAGGVIATADDLVAFAAAASDTSTDAPPWAREMRAQIVAGARPTGRRPNERYAAGLDVTSSRDEIVLRHAGNTGDFHAELVWVPARGAVVVVLANAGIPMAATTAAALVRIGVDPRRD